MSELLSLIKKNRSFRRFTQTEKPKESDLLDMIEGARLSASAGNLQRLRFTPVTEDALCDKVFDTLAFAAYLGGWRPENDEKPTAYIVIWTKSEPDTNLAIDAGIAAQSILLLAREKGFGGCMFRSIKKPELLSALDKADYVPALVIALGMPSETVEITNAENGEIKYYRDASGTHFVPKKSLEELII